LITPTRLKIESLNPNDVNNFIRAITTSYKVSDFVKQLSPDEILHYYQLIRQIGRIDIYTGSIVLESLHFDELQYPDITINIKDVERLYCVVRRVLN
jgi:hypothetical protein